MIQLVPIGKQWVRADEVLHVTTDGEDVVVITTGERVMRSEHGTTTAATAAATKFASDVNASLAP